MAIQRLDNIAIVVENSLPFDTTSAWTYDLNGLRFNTITPVPAPWSVDPQLHGGLWITTPEPEISTDFFSSFVIPSYSNTTTTFDGSTLTSQFAGMATVYVNDIALPGYPYGTTKDA